MEKFELDSGFEISRIIKGGWQLSGGHSRNVSMDPVGDMFEFAKAGITTFDCADIYTGVEDLIGKFLAERRKRMGSDSDIQVLTKFVPDYDLLEHIDSTHVEKIIDRSLKRLGRERLDMVQYAWWTYDIPGWIDVGNWLVELQKKGKIRLISATNFNSEQTQNIIYEGTHLSTVQVQYSLLDHRPEKRLIDLCRKVGTSLLCYGTLAGGFLGERWLGKEEPKPPLETRSLTKYKLIIDECGGWDLFQELLKCLHEIAKHYKVTLSNVAMRYILDKKQVAAVIIGARNIDHLESNLLAISFNLEKEHLNRIEQILEKVNKIPGDVFDIERIKDGPHGRIMKYNLNKP